MSKTTDVVGDMEQLFDHMLSFVEDNNYSNLLTMLENELQPRTCMEAIWIRDLSMGRWEIFMLQNNKLEILYANIAAAVESLLLKIYISQAPVGGENFARAQAKMDMEDFRTDEGIQAKVYDLLAEHGFSKESAQAVAYTMSAATIETLDRNIRALKQDERKLLREFEVHRELARRNKRLRDSHLTVDNTPVIEQKKTE